MESPVATDSLWYHCFEICAERARQEGSEVIKFCDVDDLAAELSKRVKLNQDKWPDK